MKKGIMVGLILLSMFSHSCSADDSNFFDDDFEIDIRVDPAVELFCIIHRLAETHQYTWNKLPKYIKEIEDSFTSFRDHSTVRLAQKLRDTHRIRGSAPMALAVYLEEPPQLKSRSARSKLDPPPHDLDARWTADIIPDFIKAAGDFAKDSKFMDFFNAHRKFYDQTVQSLYKNLKNEKLLPWFQSYFRYKPEKYTIIIGMQIGNGNYGLKITQKDGSNDYISIIGANSPSWWSGIPRFSGSWFIPTVVHEFCHSYINPLVDKNDKLLKKAGKIMYPHHMEKLGPQGYSSYKIMMYEYLVRACTIRYFHLKKDPKTIKWRIESDKKQGFPAICGLVDLLDTYEENRKRYPTLTDFMPKIAEYFNEYAASLKSRQKQF